MIKRWLCFFMAALMLFAMSSCVDKQTANDDSDTASAAVSSAETVGNYQEVTGVPFVKGFKIKKGDFESNYAKALNSFVKNAPGYMKLPKAVTDSNGVSKYSLPVKGEMNLASITFTDSNKDGYAEKLSLTYVIEGESYTRDSFNTLASLLFASLRNNGTDYNNFNKVVAGIEKEQTFSLEDTEVYVSYEKFGTLITGQVEFRFPTAA